MPGHKRYGAAAALACGGPLGLTFSLPWPLAEPLAMLPPATENLQQTASVAAVFWGVCLALVTLEATLGANPVSSGLFFLSIPALVAGLFWANRSLLRQRARFTALATLTVSVFVYATVILLLGLVAASKLKALLIHA